MRRIPAPSRIQQAPLHLASLRLRLVSLVYEGILLLAVLFLSSYLFLSVARDAQSGLPRTIFQIYLLVGMRRIFRILLDTHRSDAADENLADADRHRGRRQPEHRQGIQALSAGNTGDAVGHQLAVGAIRQGTSIPARPAGRHPHCENVNSEQ